MRLLYLKPPISGCAKERVSCTHIHTPGSWYQAVRSPLHNSKLAKTTISKHQKVKGKFAALQMPVILQSKWMHEREERKHATHSFSDRCWASPPRMLLLHCLIRAAHPSDQGLAGLPGGELCSTGTAPYKKRGFVLLYSSQRWISWGFSNTLIPSAGMS